ncbi:unnamed protein product [Soboliphyme baturini]|uniref:Uncharacterized protein n=1 Tax=Soboliphyme baturini TaxID=241478 RepID=A0A183JAX1_9BILA|nr:unnamed protein product [Soboliphyme baturini]
MFGTTTAGSQFMQPLIGPSRMSLSCWYNLGLILARKPLRAKLP